MTFNSNHKSQVTSKDVARKAGVSQSTVSRVLNKTQLGLISETTRQRVTQAANELGYTPNPIARALRNNKSKLIGIIVREISDPFFAKLIEQMTYQAREKGYHIVLGHAGSNPAEALEINNYLTMNHTDGVILLGDLKNDKDILEHLINQNRPLLALSRGSSPSEIVTVNTDNWAGIFMLMEYLLGLGHLRFGFINGGWLGDMRERLDAYKDFVKLHHLDFFPHWIQSDVNSAEGGYQATSRLLTFEELPTALISSDDEMALGVIRCLTVSGFKVPEQISVTGFDNINLSKYISPSLTTIDQKIEVLSQKAIDELITMIESTGSVDHNKFIRVVPEMIVRESTAKPLSEREM